MAHRVLRRATESANDMQNFRTARRIFQSRAELFGAPQNLPGIGRTLQSAAEPWSGLRNPSFAHRIFRRVTESTACRRALWLLVESSHGPPEGSEARSRILRAAGKL